jgi:CRP/FNR family transcriptional regulator, polysaccharide utilization system transcription regulator
MKKVCKPCVCNVCPVRRESILHGLDIDTLAGLDLAKQCTVYKKGEILFIEGHPARGLFCIKSGKIKMSRMGVEGREQIIDLIRDGDAIGYRAILDDDIYSCTAVALEDSQVCFIPRTSFYQLLENNGQLALRIAHLLAEELKEADRKLTTIVQQPVRDRITQSILLLKKNYGLEEDGSTINVVISREDMAKLAGTTRETATRMLYELQRMGVIMLIAKKIKILDEQMLQALSHL